MKIGVTELDERAFLNGPFFNDTIIDLVNQMVMPEHPLLLSNWIIRQFKFTEYETSQRAITDAASDGVNFCGDMLKILFAITTERHLISMIVALSRRPTYL